MAESSHEARPAQARGTRLPPPIRALARAVVVRTRYRGLTSEDVVAAAFPKSGGTWLRFVLATALAEREMDFDLVGEYSRVLGDQHLAPRLIPGGGRLIKSHEPYRRLTPGGRSRTLYMVRDGRDVAVSYFHHAQRREAGWPDFATFLDAFLEGKVGPYGTWQDHVLAWTRMIDRAGTSLTVRYEDMLDAPVETVQQINEHLRLGLSDERIRSAVAANTASEMRARESSSKTLTPGVAQVPFVRSAQARQWTEVFEPDAVAKFRRVAGPALVAAGYPTD